MIGSVTVVVLSGCGWEPVAVRPLSEVVPDAPVTPSPPSAREPGVAAKLFGFDDAITFSEPATTPRFSPFVRVLDDSDAGVPGVPVTFAVVEGGGALASPTVLSDAAGYARAPEWRLGPELGRNSLKASVAGLGDVLLSVEAVQPAPDFGNAFYVLQSVDSLALPVENFRTARGDTVLAATIWLDEGQFQASYYYRKDGLERVEHFHGTYIQAGMHLTFDGWRLSGAASADGRLQLYSDDDNWALTLGRRENFVRDF